MTTPDFSSPAVDTHPSGDTRHVEVPTRPSPGGSNTGRRWPGRAWLDTTAWWAEPRPPIATLLRDAREGEWTVKGWHRTCRVCWLHTAARTGRVLPWLVARRAADPPPGLCAELPAVRDLAFDCARHRALRVGWVLGSALSWVADSATRTAATTTGMWLGANWANNVPVLRWLVPDVVTAAYWWPGFLRLLQLLAPVAAAVGALAALTAVTVWRSRRAYHRRRAETARTRVGGDTSPREWGPDDDEGGA